MLQSYVLDSVTVLEARHRGAVVVAASHGGVYAGYLAARANVAAVILNDAGVGKDEAGIGALAYLQALGVCAAAVDHASARIGDGEDMRRSGVLSHVNPLARDAGCRQGMYVEEAVTLLRRLPPVESYAVLPVREARQILEPDARIPVIGIDSVSLLLPEDAGALVVAASHGGVLAASQSDGVPFGVAAIAFHDAGGGKNDAGFGRLAPLQEKGIAAVTVSAGSARIGDACSCYQSGIISRVNACAAELGAAVGQPLRLCYASWLSDRDFGMKEEESL